MPIRASQVDRRRREPVGRGTPGAAAPPRSRPGIGRTRTRTRSPGRLGQDDARRHASDHVLGHGLGHVRNLSRSSSARAPAPSPSTAVTEHTSTTRRWTGRTGRPRGAAAISALRHSGRRVPVRRTRTTCASTGSRTSARALPHDQVRSSVPSNLLAALLAAPAVGRGGVAVSAFLAPPTAAERTPPRSARRRPACAGLQAIERLHAPRDGAAGAAGRVYSLADIDRVTRTVADDEWAGLGSVIADCMLETVLDIGDAVLQKMSFVDEITLTNRIAAEVSNAVEKTLQNIRAQEHASFDVGHDLPGELVASLRALLRHELSVLAGVDDEDGSALDGYSAQLSLIAESAVHDAVEEYCGLADSRAPFFSLAHEMENRIRDRRRELLVRHSRGYEGLSDIEDDIRESRRRWTRSELGGGAARSFELGVVTTKLGNGHSREMERKEAVARQRSGLWKALTQDLDGVLMP